MPVHKKNSKQLVNNYRPVSLLPICSKIFEKVIFDSIFNFMIQNNLLKSCQSGFKPNDSCINQLISITHNIYRAFDANPSLELRGGFLDLSKAFDKVWHEGLLYKLKNNGINGNALQLMSHSSITDVKGSFWMSIHISGYWKNVFLLWKTSFFLLVETYFQLLKLHIFNYQKCFSQ